MRPKPKLTGAAKVAHETKTCAAPPPAKGSARALQSGAYVRSDTGLIFLAESVEEINSVLAQHAPVFDHADDVARLTVARLLAQTRQVAEWLDEHGPLDARGKPRPALGKLESLSNSLLKHLAQLGLTTKARADLGLSIARTVDLATAMSERDPEKRRDLLRQAGVPVEADDA